MILNILFAAVHLVQMIQKIIIFSYVSIHNILFI